MKPHAIGNFIIFFLKKMSRHFGMTVLILYKSYLMKYEEVLFYYFSFVVFYQCSILQSINKMVRWDFVTIIFVIKLDL